MAHNNKTINYETGIKPGKNVFKWNSHEPCLDSLWYKKNGREEEKTLSDFQNSVTIVYLDRVPASIVEFPEFTSMGWHYVPKFRFYPWKCVFRFRHSGNVWEVPHRICFWIDSELKNSV